MNIAIIEDERHTRETIVSIVEQYVSNATVCGTAENAQEAYKLLSTEQINIALCDINIGEQTIFDVLEKLDSIDFKLIFITAHEDYALKAIKLSAIDYLVKPLDPLELIEALKKAITTIDKDNDQIKHKVLVNNLKKPSNETERIVLKTTESIYVVNTVDIVHIKADGSYCTFHLSDGRKILVSKLIKEYDELLSDQGFLRVHQSSLVNIAAIDRYEKIDGGYLVMKNGDDVSVSVRKKEHLLSILQSM